MFESDDIDEVLSQLNYSDTTSNNKLDKNYLVEGQVHQEAKPISSTALYDRNPFFRTTENCTSSSPVQEESDKNEINNFNEYDYSDATSHNKLNKNYIFEGEVHQENKLISSAKLYDKKPILRKTENSTSTSPVQEKSLKKVLNSFNEYDNIEVCKDFEHNLVYNGHESSRENKKQILGSLFDRQSKRKFPGPAGLLTGLRDHCHADKISRIEISSQDIDCSQENLHPAVFELTLWSRLLSDLRQWGVDRVDSISSIKKQAQAGRLSSRKANTITAFVEAIDRSALNPMIILRDSSGTIKCTLHKDAWSSFASYIMSEYAALALWKPIIFTTGRTFSKQYLSITLSNIIAIYCSSSADSLQESTKLPSGYSKKVVDDFTTVRLDNIELEYDTSNNATVHADRSHLDEDTDCYLEGLDCVSFLDESF